MYHLRDRIASPFLHPADREEKGVGDKISCRDLRFLNTECKRSLGTRKTPFFAGNEPMKDTKDTHNTRNPKRYLERPELEVAKIDNLRGALTEHSGTGDETRTYTLRIYWKFQGRGRGRKTYCVKASGSRPISGARHDSRLKQALFFLVMASIVVSFTSISAAMLIQYRKLNAHLTHIIRHTALTASPFDKTIITRTTTESCMFNKYIYVERGAGSWKKKV